jgi:hypothetical protein
VRRCLPTACLVCPGCGEEDIREFALHSRRMVRSGRLPGAAEAPVQIRSISSECEGREARNEARPRCRAC